MCRKPNKYHQKCTSPRAHWLRWPTPAPSPPELVSKLPFEQFPSCTLPKPSHTPDPGVGGFERAAPTAADPKETMSSKRVVGSSENRAEVGAVSSFGLSAQRLHFLELVGVFLSQKVFASLLNLTTAFLGRVGRRETDF